MVMSVSIDRRRPVLFLGVDGGGTRCRARLTQVDGRTLGEGIAGSANIRLGLNESLLAVREAADQCLRHAGSAYRDHAIVACLALAGACEPATLTQAQAAPLPFEHVTFTSDARAACVGAHAGRDGGIIIVGTGSVGWAMAGRREYRVGGWGFPVSDEGSGAWLGCEAVRRTLWAHDGLIAWTGLLRSVFERFGCDAYAIVRWMGGAHPRDYARLAPIIIEHAQRNDATACKLVTTAAKHIDAIAARLSDLGIERVSLMGGLAAHIEPFLSDQTRSSLMPPVGDALTGAVHIARTHAVLVKLVPALNG
jgi:glucosamine kinase